MESKANKQPILPRESNTDNTSMEKTWSKKKGKKNDEHLWFAEMRWSEPTIDRRRRRPRRRGLDRSTVDSISTLHLSARECSTSDASTANRIGLLSSKTPPDRHGSYRGRILKLIGSKKKKQQKTNGARTPQLKARTSITNSFFRVLFLEIQANRCNLCKRRRVESMA